MSKLKDVVMPFGKFKGRKLDDVPLLYLDWLRGEMETDRNYSLIYQQIRDYLDKPLIKKELDRQVEEKINDQSL